MAEQPKKKPKKATRDSDNKALDRIGKEKDPKKKAALWKKLLGG
jgi:hypothetical protein